MGRQFGDEIIVLEGFDYDKVPNKRPGANNLVNFPNTGLDESSLLDESGVEIVVFHIEDYQNRPEVLSALTVASSRLKTLARDRSKIAARAAKLYSKNYELSDRLGRVGTALVKKNRDLGNIRERFVEASGRTIGYAKLNALSNYLAGSAAAQAVLLDLAALSLKAKSKAAARDALNRYRQLGIKAEQLKTDRRDVLAGAVSIVVPQTKELGFILDFIELVIKAINAIKDIVNEIKNAYGYAVCTTCKLINFDFSDDKYISIALIVGGDAIDNIKTQASQLSNKLCHGCPGYIDSSKDSPKITEQQSDIEDVIFNTFDNILKQNPNYYIFTRLLVDGTRDHIKFVLRNKYDYNEGQANYAAMNLVSIKNIEYRLDAWYNDRIKAPDSDLLNKLKIIKTGDGIRPIPLLTGCMTEDDWAAIYGFNLLTRPGFLEMVPEQQWWVLVDTANWINCLITDNRWVPNPTPAYPGQYHCEYVDENRHTRYGENYSAYSVAIGKTPATNKVAWAQKLWTDRVPGDYGVVKAANDAIAELLNAATIGAGILHGINAQTSAAEDLLENNPNNAAYANDVKNKIEILRAGIPNAETTVNNVRPYNKDLAALLSNEIQYAKNNVNRGDYLLNRGTETAQAATADSETTAATQQQACQAYASSIDALYSNIVTIAQQIKDRANAKDVTTPIVFPAGPVKLDDLINNWPTWKAQYEQLKTTVQSCGSIYINKMQTIINTLDSAIKYARNIIAPPSVNVEKAAVAVGIAVAAGAPLLFLL